MSEQGLCEVDALTEVCCKARSNTAGNTLAGARSVCALAIVPRHC